MPRQRIHVEIDGLVAVHAVRAVRTALAAIPAIETADVSMAGAVLDVSRPVTLAELAAALEPAGVRVVRIRVERAGLPLA